MSAEFHTSQFVVAQPFREDPKRRHREIVVVADQPQREPDHRQVQAPRHVHGDAEIREETRSRQESRRGHQKRFATGKHA